VLMEEELARMRVGDELIAEIMLQELRIRGGVRYGAADIAGLDGKFGRYWSSVLQTLHSFAWFKRGGDDAAYEMLPEYQEFRYPLLRMYCYYRWNKNLERYNDLLEKTIKELVATGAMELEDAGKWLGLE